MRKRRSNPAAVPRSPGFSLIELLVASVVALLVLGGIYQLVQQNQKVYKYQAQLADTQQGVRGALDLMSREIRHVGSDPNDKAFETLEPLPAADRNSWKIHIRMDLPHDCGGAPGDDDPAPCPSLACGGSCEDGDTDDILDKDGDGVVSVGTADGKRGENEFGNGFTDDINPDEDVTYVYCADPTGVWDATLCPADGRNRLYRIVNAQGVNVTEPFADYIDMGTSGDPDNPLRPMFQYLPDAVDPTEIIITVRGRTRDPDPQAGTYKYVEITSRVQLKNM